MNVKYSILSALALTCSHNVLAQQASPWLPEPGALSVNISQVEQSADQLYVGGQRQDLPSDLDQSTTALNVVYGLSDRFSLDATVGYADSDFNASEQDLSGITDSNIGITYQLVNEFAHENAWVPSVSARAGVIIDGDYRVGTVDAIGDGGNGAEISVAVGKQLNPYIAVSTYAGYRDRSNDVPAELLYGASLYATPFERWNSFVSYNVADSLSGLDIGGPGFAPDRFPEVEEDRRYIQLGLQYAITDQFSAGVSAATIVDGRNTADSDIYGLTLSYNTWLF